MPPKKKPKKKPKAKKPKAKKIVLALPQLPTGYNRDIPFGGGGGGGSGNLIAALASRPPVPIQTPEQFNAIQEIKKTQDIVTDIASEQVKVRKERSDKGKKRPPQMPTEVVPSIRELATEAPPTVVFTGEKIIRKKKQPPPTPPPPVFPPPPPPQDQLTVNDNGLRDFPVVEGGGKPQQGLLMGTSYRLQGDPPDYSNQLNPNYGIGDSEGPP